MIEPIDDLTAEFVRDVLKYDPETGVFTWLKPKTRVFPGDIAGYVNSIGYVKIRLGGVKYSAHRLAWLYHYGVWPSQVIDHINHNRSDNRITNLRDVSHTENMGNRIDSAGRASDRPGVRKSRNGRWESYTAVGGKYYHFGTFDTEAEAAATTVERRALLLKAA